MARSHLRCISPLLLALACGDDSRPADETTTVTTPATSLTQTTTDATTDVVPTGPEPHDDPTRR
jgi:hypothetical protein